MFYIGIYFSLKPFRRLEKVEISRLPVENSKTDNTSNAAVII